MKRLSFLACAAFAALFTSGCSSIPVVGPFAGKATRIGELDGPPGAPRTGSILCAFGNAARPSTKWWIDSKLPPSNPNLIHKVGSSVDGVVSGFEVGPHTLYFRVTSPNCPPDPYKVYVTWGKTAVVAVNYSKKSSR